MVDSGGRCSRVAGRFAQLTCLRDNMGPGQSSSSISFCYRRARISDMAGIAQRLRDHQKGVPGLDYIMPPDSRPNGLRPGKPGLLVSSAHSFSICTQFFKKTILGRTWGAAGLGRIS